MTQPIVVSEMVHAAMLLVKVAGLDTLTIAICTVGACLSIVLGSIAYELNRIANAQEIALEKKQ